MNDAMSLDVKITSIRPEGNPVAIASVNLNDCFVIGNIRIMDGSKGLFISMPSYKTADGKYKDICYPLTKEFRDQLSNAVLEEYDDALENLNTNAPAQQM